MPSPWLILATVLVFGGAVSGAYVKGGRDAVNREAAQAAREEKIARIAYENGQRAAAEEVAKIKVVNKTFRETLEKEIFHDPVYSTCEHSDSTFSLLNRHLQGPPGGPVGDSELSGDLGQPD